MAASRNIELAFNVMCATTTCLCLLTVVYSNYLGLFATRLALRGGDDAVEEAVVRIRGEYKVVLYALTASVECFIATLPVLAFYKMDVVDAVVVAVISLPSLVLVLYLYRRARQLFYLDKSERFAAHDKNTADGKHIDLGDGWGGTGGRASTDGLGDGRGSLGRASSLGADPRLRMRRSVSFDEASAYAKTMQAYAPPPKANLKFLGSKKLGTLFGSSASTSGYAGKVTATNKI